MLKNVNLLHCTESLKHNNDTEMFGLTYRWKMNITAKFELHNMTRAEI